MRLLTLLILSIPAIALAQISHLELGAANYGQWRNVRSSQRLQILEQTARELIQKYGAQGTIYLNDINADGLDLAVEYLQNWLSKNSYGQIKVEPLPGNFNAIGLPKVKTAHLSNPEHSMLPSFNNGPQNIQIVRNLERIAAQSETGLKITSYFTSGDQDYVSRIGEYASKSILQKVSEDGYEYHTPFGVDWRTMYNNVNAKHTSTFVLRSCDSILAN